MPILHLVFANCSVGMSVGWNRRNLLQICEIHYTTQTIYFKIHHYVLC